MAVAAAIGCPLALEVVPSGELGERAAELRARFQPRLILLGDGTGRQPIAAALQGLQIPVKIVAERNSTLRARRRYWQDHPRRGWRRWLPLSLQTPPRPVDDYAALILVEDYLAQESQP